VKQQCNRGAIAGLTRVFARNDTHVDTNVWQVLYERP
jgi:hypothetical protein